MGRFHVIEDSYCILYAKGVFRQTPLYERRADVYAKYGTGYIRLLKHGYTTAPDVKWREQQRGPAAEILKHEP